MPQQNTVNTVIVLRNDNTVNWEKSDYILYKGEIGIEFLQDNSSQIKIGDGVNTWRDLPYAADKSKVEIFSAKNLESLPRHEFTTGSFAVVGSELEDKSFYLWSGESWLKVAESYDTRIKNLADTLGGLSNFISNFDEGTLTNLDSKIGTNTTKIEGLAADFLAMQASINSISAGGLPALAAIENRVSALEKNNHDITSLQELTNDINSRVSANTGDISSLLAKISNADSGLDKTFSLVKEALTEVNRASAKISSIETDYIKASDELLLQC